MKSRDLVGMSTVRGVRLWQTPGEVMEIYGTAVAYPVPSAPGVSVLSYTTWPPRKTVRRTPPCGQFENFFFRKSRLILIQLGDGC